MAISLVLVVNKELLVKNQVLHQVKIELDHNHPWILKAKDNKTKDKITKIKRKVATNISQLAATKNYLTQGVMDK